MDPNQLLERCATYNTKRLVRGLLQRGVIFVNPISIDNLYIRRDPGQPMMNKAAGEAAPTWNLVCNGERYHDRWYNGDKEILTVFEGIDYNEINSYIPLKWILKFKPEEWDIGMALDWENELQILVKSNPPHWDRY